MRDRAGLGLLALVACRADFVLDERESQNGAPYAHAGTGSHAIVEETLTLDGSGSFDPEGDPLLFSWRVITRPMNSQMVIADPMATTTTFVPDVVGRYEFELTVSDGSRSVTSEVAYAADAPLLEVEVDVAQQAPWRSLVQITGTVTSAPGFDAPYTWTLEKPERSSATLIGADTLTPSFFADLDGSYTVRLVAEHEHAQRGDSAVILVDAARRVLPPYPVSRADYSTALRRMVLATEAPPMLRLVDPVTGTESSVALPSSASDLSISPDGLRAAVAHANAVSIVSLQPLAVAATHAAPFERFQLVLDGSNNVTLLHGDGFQSAPLRTMNATTGVVTTGEWPHIYSGAYGRLHPGGNAVYTVTGSISPADIERVDVTAVPAAWHRESPHHGAYDMGPDLWTSADGFSIYSGNNVFHASESPGLDMTFRAHLGGSRSSTLNWAVQSTATNRLATLHTIYGTFGPLEDELRVHDASTFALLETVPLPDELVGGVPTRVVSRVVAFSPDASSVFVLTTADAQTTSIFTVPL